MKEIDNDIIPLSKKQKVVLLGCWTIVLSVAVFFIVSAFIIQKFIENMRDLPPDGITYHYIPDAKLFIKMNQHASEIVLSFSETQNWTSDSIRIIRRGEMPDFVMLTYCPPATLIVNDTSIIGNDTLIDDVEVHSGRFTVIVNSKSDTIPCNNYFTIAKPSSYSSLKASHNGNPCRIIKFKR